MTPNEEQVARELYVRLVTSTSGYVFSTDGGKTVVAPMVQLRAMKEYAKACAKEWFREDADD